VILWFVHGWGFDASLWEELAAALPEFRAVYEDRGYFGPPHDARPSEPCIAVAHSFGAWIALQWPAPACRGLVAIHGFDCFTAREGCPGVAPRIVDRMRARLAADPHGVLREFRRRCGEERAVEDLEVDRLRADLDALRDLDGRPLAAGFSAPIVSLQGAADPIVPRAMRDAVFASNARTHRIVHPSAGHLLPRTDPALCASAIRELVEQVS
jgi:pimeloyl-[acyl-carrier protein] methyl ester esterase